MEKKTICYVDIAKNEGFYNPHFQTCSWTKKIFSEIIKWWSKNATSLSFSQIETMFGRKLDKKHAEQYHERKDNFTLLFAKHYLYNTKLTHGEISISDFIAKVNHKYSLAGLIL